MKGEGRKRMGGMKEKVDETVKRSKFRKLTVFEQRSFDVVI